MWEKRITRYLAGEMLAHRATCHRPVENSDDRTGARGALALSTTCKTIENIEDPNYVAVGRMLGRLANLLQRYKRIHPEDKAAHRLPSRAFVFL